MRWFSTLLFSNSSSNSNPSSSSSSSPPPPPPPPPPSSSSSSFWACDHRKNNRSAWLFGSGKRSRRSCRKVNHIADLEALVVPPLSRSTSTFDSSSASVQPQPLPLPRDADTRFPSPNAATLPAVSLIPPFRMRSVFASEDRRKSTEQVERRSTGVAGHHGQGDSFCLNIPARSAPTSPFESPRMSQNTAKIDDFVPYHYVSTKGNHFWSAPEMPTFDTSVPHPVFFDNIPSPHQSPRGKSPTQKHPRSPTGPSFSPSTIPPRLSLDTSIARRETINAPTVHPLPLPPWAGPGPLLLSPSVAKTESTPMKDQWQKGKLLGRGTFGTVYVATNRNTGALCAMKEAEIYADDPKSAECIKQLEQEIKVLSHLKHPNIVQYYGSEIVEDKFYIYLEYIHPGSINKYVREHCGAITECVVRNFTRHILSGLAYLHSKKTIHRDIKGANLLVDSAGVVKLADFGMAKHLTGHVADLSLKGSPYWMAPELLQAVVKKDNSSDLAFAVDIWSLGCTIIEMYTGKPPWSEYEGAAALFKVMKDTPPIPETLSAEGKDFLRLCFIRNPAERPSASMLLEHRFLKNLQQSDVSSSMHLYHGTNLMDINSPKDSSENKPDQISISRAQIAKGKLVTESGILFV